MSPIRIAEQSTKNAVIGFYQGKIKLIDTIKCHMARKRKHEFGVDVPYFGKIKDDILIALLDYLKNRYQRIAGISPQIPLEDDPITFADDHRSAPVTLGRALCDCIWRRLLLLR